MQTTRTKGKYHSTSSGETFQDSEDDGDDYDDFDDDDGVADLRESLPTLPGTQSFMERLHEHKPDWDDYEENDDDEEVKKWRRKAEAEYHAAALDKQNTNDNNDNITK